MQTKSLNNWSTHKISLASVSQFMLMDFISRFIRHKDFNVIEVICENIKCS